MKKVLILEDEENIRSFVVINLQRAGYAAIEAGAGQEALDRLRENPDVGVAILDIMLPDMDGFEVCRRIRAANKQIGIIMLTARTQEMDKVTGLMTGADDYVTKPFSPAELTARVDALFRRISGDGMAFRRAFIQSGFKLAACLIWRKQSAVLGRGDYHFQHEPILYGWRPGAAHRWHGNRKQKTIYESCLDALTPMADGSWQLMIDGKLYRLRGEALSIEELASSIISVPKPAKSDLHPTTKPVALIERMVANSSPAKGLVLDPFGGSGSTLMACELLGRSCRTMELDPRFAEVIIRRWQDYTGGQALREADGATLGVA